LTNKISQRIKKKRKNTNKHLKIATNNQQQEQDGGEHLQPYNSNQGQPNANQQLDLLKETTTSKVRRSATQSRWQSIYPTDQQRRQSIRPQRIQANDKVAKHPPEQHSGKVSAYGERRQSIRQPTTSTNLAM